MQVQRDAVLEVAEGRGPFDQFGHFGVVVVVALRGGGDVQRVQEVVRVSVVGVPGQDEGGRAAVDGCVDEHAEVHLVDGGGDADFAQEEGDQFGDEIGRASCRERVKMWGVRGGVK